VIGSTWRRERRASFAAGPITSRHPASDRALHIAAGSARNIKMRTGVRHLTELRSPTRFDAAHHRGCPPRPESRGNIFCDGPRRMRGAGLELAKLSGRCRPYRPKDGRSPVGSVDQHGNCRWANGGVTVSREAAGAEGVSRGSGVPTFLLAGRGCSKVERRPGKLGVSWKDLGDRVQGNFWTICRPALTKVNRGLPHRLGGNRQQGFGEERDLRSTNPAADLRTDLKRLMAATLNRDDPRLAARNTFRQPAGPPRPMAPPRSECGKGSSS